MNLKFLKIKKVKKSKKIRVYFKIFGQNRIEKIEILHPTKFDEVQNGVKIMKKRKSLDFFKNRSILSQNYSVSVLSTGFR
jgi:hypothetical protein